MGDTRRGSQKLRRYVEEEWLPHHEMEARTRENYSYYLERHILPEFGSMRMVEILPLDVRRWVTKLKSDGVSPTVIRYCKTVLSAIFTTALNDQVTQLHPCRGVKTPPVPKRPAPSLVLSNSKRSTLRCHRRTCAFSRSWPSRPDFAGAS
jgi:site-specific recombinase XerC